MTEKKKTSSKKKKCADADRVLTRLKENEEKIRELTEKVIPMHIQVGDLTKELLELNAKVDSNDNIFKRIKQRLGLWYVTF